MRTRWVRTRLGAKPPATARGVHKNIPQVFVPSIRHKGDLGENPACLRISGQDVEVVQQDALCAGVEGVVG